MQLRFGASYVGVRLSLSLNMNDGSAPIPAHLGIASVEIQTPLQGVGESAIAGGYQKQTRWSLHTHACKTRRLEHIPY